MSCVSINQCVCPAGRLVRDCDGKSCETVSSIDPLTGGPGPVGVGGNTVHLLLNKLILGYPKEV